MDIAARRIALNRLGNLFPALLLFGFVIVHTSTPVTFILKLTNGLGGAAVGAIWYLGGLCALGLALFRPWETIKATPFAFPFLIVTAWSAASFFWSIAPIETIKGVLLLTLTTLGAIVIAARLSWEELVRYFSNILNALILISIVLAVGVPKLGTMETIYPGAWSGLWPEKQALGFYSVIQVIFVFIRAFYLQRQMKMLLWSPLGIIAILGTQSKTALIMVVFAIAIMVFVKLLQQDLRIMLGTLILAIVGIVLIYVILMSFPDLLFKLTGKSADLTGRKEIWTALEFIHSQNKTVGYGYSALWTGMNDLAAPYQWIPDIAGFKPFNSHSSYWEAKVSLGEIGLYLLYFCLGWVLIFSIIHIRSHPLGSGLTLSLMGALLLISRTETVFLGHGDLYWLLVITLGTKITMPKTKPETILRKNIENAPQRETYVYTGI